MEDTRREAEQRYDWIGNFYEGRASVELNDKWGFVDLDGKEVVPPIYDLVGRFSEGRARIKLDGKWGVIDLEGNVVVSLLYDWVRSFRQGRSVVERNGKWGVVDLDGNEVIPCWYTDVERQSYGFKAAHRVSPNIVMKLHFDSDGNPIAEPVNN
jgi:hypothetical protein